ncbi:probably inactive leucine-rich repeat receptor-like protein kinase At5g48380 [Populus alba]|nr:probably inactive leucine-rich repeat receptor-like protein kinase At5g48380 [Populus alba]TKS07431.1 putative inactive leucine-rich repeat receptor-like protein kinase [Populus alba]
MVMLILRKNRKEADNLSASPSFESIHGGGKEISMLEKKVPRMSYTDLKDATNNFSENNVIGQGKIGMLYKAALPSGYLFAVKKLHSCRILEEQFVLELKTLGSLRHVNLLQLLGFLITSKHWLLVYKYMTNGNLYDWLHPMEWTVRFKVAIGLARGLAWLHQDCSSTILVYHLNISSKCILLDQDFEPKLSNFGEAIIVNPTNTSPFNGEFWDAAFAKEDVYGFGVVLLELITGVDSSRMTGSSNSLLNEWMGHLLTSSKIYDAIDKSLIGQGFDDEIFQLLKVAWHCVDSIPDRRPTMHQVYKDIRAMRERCGQIDDSEILVQHHEIHPPSSKGKSVESMEMWKQSLKEVDIKVEEVSVSSATEPDVYCLKSIKDSLELEDPYNHFSSCDFTNQTEGFICRFTGVECWHPDENRVLKLALSNMLIPFQIEDQQCIKCTKT